MRMLFINQFFWPDSSATSQQLTDLVGALAARGTDVAVLCGEGGYAFAAGGTPPRAEVRADGLAECFHISRSMPRRSPKR